MTGMVRLAYWLGWVFLCLTLVARIFVYTSLVDRMIAWGVLPRNFLQGAFLFFLISIATALYNREVS